MWKCTPRWGTVKHRCAEPMSTARRTELTCSMPCSNFRTRSTPTIRNSSNETYLPSHISTILKTSSWEITKSYIIDPASERTRTPGTNFASPIHLLVFSTSLTVAISTPYSNVISSWELSPAKSSLLRKSPNFQTSLAINSNA